jgi:hypothetical protein
MRAFLAASLAVVVVACGARSGLLSSDETMDATAPGADASLDAMDRSASDVAPLEATLPDMRVADMHVPGCTSNTDCDDGVACTVDTCNTSTGVCSHQPNDALCPAGFTCQPKAGCVATAFAVADQAVGQTNLYGVALPEGTVENIGPTSGHSLTNIALDSKGNLFGVSLQFLYSVDPLTGAATRVGPVAGNPNALGFGPDGTLYTLAEHDAAGSNGVFSVDPTTGDETFLADLPFGYVASGDLAVVGRTLYATVAGGSEDELATIDLDTLEGTVLGPIGFGCVWGLAAYGGTLFGFTCNGDIIQIDSSSAIGTLVSTPGESFAGAATP